MIESTRDRLLVWLDYEIATHSALLRQHEEAAKSGYDVQRATGEITAARRELIASLREERAKWSQE